MFFVKEIRKDVLIEAKFLSNIFHEIVKQQLISSLEGKVVGQYGYLIKVMEIRETRPGHLIICSKKFQFYTAIQGLIEIDTGSVNVDVVFTAIFLIPIKREVLDAVVTDVSDVGIHCSVGPLEIFVPQSNIPNDFVFDQDRYRSETPDDDTEEVDSEEIMSGSLIRLRIQGVAMSRDSVTAMGTLNEPFLGPILSLNDEE